MDYNGWVGGWVDHATNIIAGARNAGVPAIYLLNPVIFWNVPFL